MSARVEVRQASPELVVALADELVEVARTCVTRSGRFAIALAGGSTPRALYLALAGQPYRDHIDWPAVQVYFGDERAVPADDELSNFGMARRALLDSVPIPSGNVHPMSGAAIDLEAAAADYQRQLRELGAPLDVVLLGIGDDGHTASLFPHSPALAEGERLCVATGIAPLEPHVRRLTLTYPALNAARRVHILATGAGKAARVAQALGAEPLDPGDSSRLPIQAVQPRSGDLTWWLDGPAAERL